MKVVKGIYNVLSALVLVVCVGLVFLLIGMKWLGFTPYAVLSGSMEPEYEVGSVVYVKAVEAEDIEVGDAITFYMSNSTTVVTHQVIEIDEENGLYYTQGLANDAADGSPTTADNIIGKVHFGIPYLGYISSYITSPPWTYIIIGIVLIWMIVLYMIDISKEEDPEELEEVELLEEDTRTTKSRRRGKKKRF